MPLLDDQLLAARAAVDHAQDVRVIHAGRVPKGTPRREAAIAAARERLKEAMAPLRAHLGRVAFASRSLTEEDYARVREASAAIQTERRKLWKMAAR